MSAKRIFLGVVLGCALLVADLPAFAGTEGVCSDTELTFPVFQVMDETVVGMESAHNAYNVFFSLTLVNGVVASGFYLVFTLFRRW